MLKECLKLSAGSGEQFVCEPRRGAHTTQPRQLGAAHTQPVTAFWTPTSIPPPTGNETPFSPLGCYLTPPCQQRRPHGQCQVSPCSHW